MRRALFQFHLSTAVVLMFVAGGLLWANMRASTRVTVLVGTKRVLPAHPIFGPIFSGAIRTLAGWPLTMRVYRPPPLYCHGDPPPMSDVQRAEYAQLPAGEISYDDFVRCAPSLLDRVQFGADPTKPGTVGEPWIVSGIVLNALVALAILLATAVLLEWRIRRRSAVHHRDAEAQRTDT